MNKAEMTVRLTNSCLEYLCRDHHDPETPIDEITEEIMCGSYRLHTYSRSMWLLLVEQCLNLNSTGSMSSEFLEGLEGFASHRSVAELEGEGTSPRPINQHFDKLKDQLPSVHNLLVRAAEFRRRCDSSGFQITNGEKFLHLN